MNPAAVRLSFPALPIAVAVAFAPAFCAAAGEAWPRPAEKPLAVLRVQSPAECIRLVDALSPAFPALKRLDGPVRPPGLAAIPDPRALLLALSDAGATGFWLGFSSGGASAIGWHEPSAGEEDMTAEIQARLRGVGIDTARMRLRTWRHEGALVVALGAIDAFFPARIRDQGRGSEWRGGFDAFIARREPGVGLWVNARPLSGLLALMFGVDLRAAFASVGWKLPEAAALTLFASGNGFGARIRLDGVGDADAPGVMTGDALAGVGYDSDAFLEASLSGLGSFLSRRSPDDFALPAAPHALSFALRTGFGAGLEWSLVAAVGEDGKAAYRQAETALELVAADPRTGVAVERRQNGLLETVEVTLGTVAFTIALKERSHGRNFILAASDGRLPDLARVEVLSGPATGLEIAWTANLRSLPWNRVERSVMAVLDNLPDGADPSALTTLMPERESGRISCAGRDLAAESPGMALLWILPYVVGEAADFLDSLSPTPSDLAAARLRFMLDVAAQSRFRGITADNLSAAPLPVRLDWLNFSDPDVKAWLADAFGRFPGMRGENWNGLRAAFSGRILDGYEYRLSMDDGWRILAVPAPGGEDFPIFAIDAEGMIAARSRDGRDSGWREEPLVTAILLWR
ncbi:MAG: hypothetical protein LBT97_05780 [Planctomycetota bacterium]|jgi:hypothetical protein|nr:hypothetical protein [Planctomycetota bacterium]